MQNGLRVSVVLLLSSAAWLFGGEVGVYCQQPPGVVKFVSPGYPAKFRRYGWHGTGNFLVKVNPKTGDVDEVKILRSTGHKLLDQLSAQAFFEWKFRPGATTQVQVPVEFYSKGFAYLRH